MTRNNKSFLDAAYQSNNDSDEPAKYFLGTGENSIGTQSGAAITVEPPKTNYSFPIYSGHSRDAYYDGGNDAYGDRDKDRGVPEGTTWADVNADESTGQIPMFNVDHTPPVMSYMVSTKDANHEAMGLAAHAAEETRIRYGERPWASPSLSKYSKAMVNSAIKSKVIKGIHGKAEGELDLSGFDNGYNWMSGATGVQEAADTVSRYVGANGEPVNDNVKKINTKGHFDTLKAELAHNRATKELGLPTETPPSALGVTRGRQFPKEDPQLDFGF